MKLWSSIKKELLLATRSFYFYVEVFFVLVLLALLLFVIPEHYRAVQDEYVYLDMPQEAADSVIAVMLEEDTDGKAEQVTLKADGAAYSALLIGKESENLYLLESADTVRTLADTQRNLGLIVSLGTDNALHYTYYLQGYETQRLKNLLSILHNGDSALLEERFDAQPVRLLQAQSAPLNDKENALPPMLAFNSSLMGMFIMAAYVFLDKKENVISAYAVTASSVPRYLASKIAVILLTGAFSSLVVTLPVLGFGINYALLLLLQLSSGFFASVLGLLIAGFYQDFTKAFGVIFAALVLMMLPAIAYFLPAWDPVWVRWIPSYPMIEGFREILTPNGSTAYVLLASAGFLAAGGLLFITTTVRFRKSLAA